MQHLSADQVFPSFAASPTHSPPRPLTRSVTKITIELPESLVDSTIDDHDNSLQQSKEDPNSQPLRVFGLGSIGSMGEGLEGCGSKEEGQGQNVRVYCRFRPANHPSQLRHDATMLDDGENRYSFDGIFGSQFGQQEVYEAVASRHIQAFFRGENSTLFTYGQTGSGKTYTMFGELKEKQRFGLIPRAL